MIKIERHPDMIPDILKSENGRAKKETDKAIAFYDLVENHDKAFKFKVYGHADVKEALIKLCNDKCAYCESKFLHVYVGDVEHFRPKGRVKDRDTPRPGYYWLAADWDNLLLSCRNCNQSSKQFLLGGDDKKISVGKLDQFPLLDTADTTVPLIFNTFKLDEEEEDRLLINPCIENPEEYFEYDLNGVIKPNAAIKNDPKKKAMAKKSIDVFALQRVPLVQAREKRVIEILAQIQRVKEAMERMDKATNRSQTFKLVAEAILERELMRLRAFRDKDQEFIGLARQLVGKFEKELNQN